MHTGNTLLRRFVAILAMAALLFMQLAVSAYACTGEMGSGLVGDSAWYSAIDCDEAADGQPPLCQSHCNPGAQSLDKPQVSNIPPPAILEFASTWSPMDRFASPVTPVSLTRPLPGLSAPPLAIRNCCFRL